MASMKEHQLQLQDELLAAVKQAANTAMRSTRQRDQLIVEGRQLGLSLRELAAATSLSHTAIAKIVTRDTDQ